MIMHTLAAPRASNWNKLWCVNYFFFWKKYEKFCISPIIGVCLNNHDLFQFEALGAARVCISISNTQTFHFSEIYLVCLFPTYVRNFREKRQKNLKKSGKRDWKQTNSKIFWETDKVPPLTKPLVGIGPKR